MKMHIYSEQDPILNSCILRGFQHWTRIGPLPGKLSMVLNDFGQINRKPDIDVQIRMDFLLFLEKNVIIG